MEKQKYIDEIYESFVDFFDEKRGSCTKHTSRIFGVGQVYLTEETLKIFLKQKLHEAEQNEKERIIEIIKSVMKDWECVTEIDNPASIEDLTKDIINKIKELK